MHEHTGRIVPLDGMGTSYKVLCAMKDQRWDFVIAIPNDELAECGEHECVVPRLKRQPPEHRHLGRPPEMA